MKRVRDIRPENLTNYILGIITETFAIVAIMLSAYIVIIFILQVLK